jgi:hypothetical protein
MADNGIFSDPNLHAWVDLPTNFASLPGVRLEHVKMLSEGRVPGEIVNTVMHEMTHHWCFFTSVGEVLSLLQHRVRDALLRLSLGQSIDEMDVVCDLARYEITESALRPIIEGMALFMEYDAVAGGPDVTYCRPLHFFSIVILRELAADKFMIHLVEIDRRLRANRTRPEGVRRKASLLAMPLASAKSIYLNGYLATKAFVYGKNQDFGGSYDKMLGYLRSYFFEDYGLIDAMFGDSPKQDDPVTIAKRIFPYLNVRMQNLFKSDLGPSVAEWDPPEPITAGYSDDIKLGERVIFPLRAIPTRGIGVSAEAEAKGYARHRELFRVLDTLGESEFLVGYKQRALKEILNRALMPVSSDRILSSARAKRLRPGMRRVRSSPA